MHFIHRIKRLGNRPNIPTRMLKQIFPASSKHKMIVQISLRKFTDCFYISFFECFYKINIFLSHIKYSWVFTTSFFSPVLGSVFFSELYPPIYNSVYSHSTLTTSFVAVYKVPFCVVLPISLIRYKFSFAREPKTYNSLYAVPFLSPS